MHVPSILANLHYVTPELARCAQPFTLSQVRAILRRHKFRTLVNLRGENPKAYWYKDEKQACAELGCAHVDIMLSSKRLPAREDLERLADQFDHAAKPILIKCSGGADRTGLASALFLLMVGGLASLPSARNQLRLLPYWHKPKPQQRWIRAWFDFLTETIGTLSVREWLATIYDADAFASYLTAKGKGDYWRQD